MTDFYEKLKGVRMQDIGKYLGENKNEMIEEKHAFADYMRSKFKEKGLLQQDIFLQADIPERYGYKLISQEYYSPDLLCGSVFFGRDAESIEALSDG